MKRDEVENRPLKQLPFVVGVLVLAMVAPNNLRADEYADVSRLVGAGRLADAASISEKFLNSKPRDAQMRFLKGVVQAEQGKVDEAIVSFTRLTEDFPALPEPYNNLAVLYAQKFQLGKARAALEIATRINPDYVTALENLGDIHVKLANISYSNALKIDRHNTVVALKLNMTNNLLSHADGKAMVMEKPIQHR